MTIAAQQDEDARAIARAELIAWLLEANTKAKQQPYVIELFFKDPPTKWTLAHRDIDDLLDQLEATG